MRKFLIYWLCGATLTTGCSAFQKAGDSVSGFLDRTPLMYRIDVQQGNVITQEMVDRLQPGMTKSQAQYVMGTPTLIDVFHQDRWDYVYSMKRNREPREQQRVSLFFEDDRLIRIEGDMRPLPLDEQTPVDAAEVVNVPDYGDTSEGLLERVLDTVGLGGD